MKKPWCSYFRWLPPLPLLHKMKTVVKNELGSIEVCERCGKEAIWWLLVPGEDAKRRILEKEKGK